MLACGALPYYASAQEALRMSLTSAEAAELRRKAATTLGYYNIKAGPTAWNFAAGLEAEYTDNVRLEPSQLARADLSLRPRVDTRMIWPVSQQNSLNLRLGAGYAFYVQHSEFNRYFISPGTELAFDLYVGKAWLSFHDRITITEDTYQDPTIVGAADYSRLENELGFTAVWDLNRIIARFGYDHANYLNLASGKSAYPDGQAEMFFTTIGYLFKPEMTAGIEAGASLVSYDPSASTTFTKALQYSGGGFYEARVSEYIKGRASAGYSVMSPTGGSAEGDDNSGFYAQLGLAHRLNEYVDYTLTGSKRMSFTFYGGSLDLYAITWMANWRVMRKTRIDTSFTYEHGKRLYAFLEEFDRFGPSIGINKALSEKIFVGARYTFYLRKSDVNNWDYTANIINLNARYQF